MSSDRFPHFLELLLLCPIVVGLLSMVALGQTNYHVRLAQDYYDPAQNGERPGRFMGHGAALLGLGGKVTPQAFRALMEGFAPTTGKPLVQNAGMNRRDTAIDCVFSPFKSFSVVRGLTLDSTTFVDCSAAFDWSVERAVERMTAHTFIRKGAKGRWVSASPVISSFVHESSRALDPQCHVHLACHNLAVTADGQTGAVLTRPYFQRKMAWGALFRCDLAFALQQRFPEIKFRRGKAGVEIDGVPEEVLRRFSSRRRAIEEELAGMESETAAAKQFACLTTRDPKETVPPFVELATKWRAISREMGFEPTAIPSLLASGHRQAVDRDSVLKDSLQSAVEQLSLRHSHFTALDLLRFTADFATGRGVSGEQVESFVARQLQQSASIIRIGKWRGQDRFSTPAILAEERSLVDHSELLSKARWGGVTTAKLVCRASLSTTSVIANWFRLENDTSLSADQRKAISSLALDSHQLSLLTGPNVSDRMTAIGRVAELYSACGYEVLAIATGASHANQLATRTGLTAVTLPWFLGVAGRDQSWWEAAKHAGKQLVREAVGRRIGLYPFARTNLLGASSVVIVDGAERIGTQEMAALVDGCAYYGAKLILSGDRDGFRSMDRGVPFRALCDRLPHATLGMFGPTPTPHHDALEKLQAGNARFVVSELAADGRLTVSKTAEESVAKLVSDWRDSGGVSHPRQHLIVAATSAERLAIHREIRDRRRQSESQTTESVILDNGEDCSAGDRVICLKSSKRYGVTRGQLATVLGVSRRLDIVQISLDDGQITTLPLATYRYLQLAFAVDPTLTIPDAEHVYALLGTDRDSRQSALALFSSAGRSLRVYTDESRAGVELADLTRRLAADHSDDLAVDVASTTQSQA